MKNVPNHQPVIYEQCHRLLSHCIQLTSERFLQRTERGFDTNTPSQGESTSSFEGGQETESVSYCLIILQICKYIYIYIYVIKCI